MTEDNKHRQYSRAVIAGALSWPAIMDDQEVSLLEPAYFFGGDIDLWGKMKALQKDGRLSTVNLISACPPSSGYDFSYFAALMEEYSRLPLGDVVEYARGLRHYATRRSLNEIAGRIAMASRSDDPDLAVSWAMDQLAYWSMGKEPTDQPIKEVLLEVFEEAVRRSQDPKDVWGIPSGFRRLDIATGGLQQGELVIIGGEPGVGKTWFSTQLAMQASSHAPGAFLSLEMRRVDIVRRMMGILGVSRKKMMTGRMEQEDFQMLDEAMAEIQKLSIIIDDRSLKLTNIRPMLARHKAKHDIKWFVLDYLYLIDAPGINEIEKTQNISRELKLVCKELDLAGIVLHSVNKSGMDIKDTGKSKLRGSGQVVHDADVIYMLTKFTPVDSRDSLMLPAMQDKTITLHVEKGRELEKAGGVIHYQRRATSPGFDEVAA